MDKLKTVWKKQQNELWDIAIKYLGDQPPSDELSKLIELMNRPLKQK